MKYRVTKLAIPLLDDIIVKYTVEYREHWWNRWRFVMDGQIPQLFSENQIIRMRNLKRRNGGNNE